MATPFISEIKYTGNGNEDFIEIMVDAGTSVAGLTIEIYNPNGTLRSTSVLNFAPANTVNGKDIYVLNAASPTAFNGLHRFGAIALVQDGTVLQFNSFTEGGTFTAATPSGAAAGMTTTVIGTAGAGSSLSGNPTSGYVTTTPPTPGMPCFVAGTLIDTISGPRAIETLKPGDLVVTADNGLQPVRWIGCREVCLDDPGFARFAPICIKAHQFGPGCPEVDVWLSPGHRVLMQGQNCNLMFGQSEVLASTRFLLGDRIRQDHSRSHVTYCHLMFDRHEIVQSHGLRSESFFPGNEGLNAITCESRAEMFAIFPELRSNSGGYGPTARRDLKQFEGRLLAA